MAVANFSSSISVHRYMIQSQSIVYQRRPFANFQEAEEIQNVHYHDAVFGVGNELLHRLIACEAICDIVFEVFQQSIQNEMAMNAMIGKQLIMVVCNEQQSLSKCGTV